MKITAIRFVDLLFIIILFTVDMGTVGLSLNLYQYVMLFFLAYLLVIECLQNKKLLIPKQMIGLSVYMLVISCLFKSDFESFKGLVFFVFELVAFYLYLRRTTIETIYKIIYRVAFVFAVYGIWQEIAFITGHLQWAGLEGKRLEVRSGLLAVSSFYSEPAHCTMICALGVWVILLSRMRQVEFTNWLGNILIIVFTYFTQSLMVYFTSIVAVMIFFFVNNKKKWSMAILMVNMAMLLVAVKPEVVLNTFGRLKQFKTLRLDTGNDLSAVALVSNFRVALENMKHGYLFGTGFDTHRIVYWENIHNIYSHLYMYLNSEDAGSLYIRIFTEFGIVGFVIFLGTILLKLRNAIRLKSIDMIAMICLFLTGMLRLGQYQDVYLILLFCCIFYKRDLFISDEKTEERQNAATVAN